MVFEHRERVYYSDTDAEGIAYHKAYFDWAEHARSEILLRYNPETVKTGGAVVPVITHIEIRYYNPAHLDDEIIVRSEAAEAKRFSACVKQEIFSGDSLLASLDVKFAFINSQTMRPELIPDRFLAALKGESV